MSDLFAQHGIDFQSSSMAGTHPSAEPDAITAPQIDFQAPEAAPAPAAPAPARAGKMTPDEQNAAIIDLYGDTGAEPAPQAVQQNGESAGRDLFAERGISAPTIAETNNNAYGTGLPLPAESQSGTMPPAEMPDSWAPVSRAEMSLPPETQDANRKAKWQAQQYAAEDYASAVELAKKRFGEDKIKEWQNNPIRFVEGFQRLNTNQVLPLGGISQGYDALKIADLAKKRDAGETLTPGENKQLTDFVDWQLEQRIRGWHWSGNVAYIGSQIPAFALEFAASDGYGKMAQVAAVRGAEELALHSALSTAAGVTTRIATTTALMPGQYIPKFGERRLNDAVSVTDRGDIVLKPSTESPGKSFLMAFGYTAADVATQQFIAPLLGKYAVEPAGRVLATPLVAGVNRLPAAVKDAMYQAYKVIQPNAQVSKVFTAAGWNGALEQLGANRVNEILHATLDMAGEDKMTWDQYGERMKGAVWPSMEQFMTEAALVSIGGGISAGARASYNLMRSKGVPAAAAKDSVENMSAMEHEAYLQDNLPTPKSDYVRLSDEQPQDVMTPEDAARAPVKRGLYSDIDDRLQTQTPEQKDLRLKMLNQKMIAGIITTKEMYEREAITGAAPHPDTVLYDGTVGKTQLDTGEAKEPPPINDHESMFNTYYRAMHHDAAAAEIPFKNAVKAGETPGRMDNTVIWIATNHQIPVMIDYYTNTSTFKMDAEGYPIDSGKSLKAVLDDFDNYFMAKERNGETRRSDFNDFLIARHYISLTENAKHILVTPEQLAKSKADLQRIADKYGEDAHFFETFGNELVEFRNRTRDLLVGNLLTPEARAREKKLYPYSIPLKREITPEEHQAGLASGDYAALNPGDLTKRLKGSALPVKDIIHSVLRETARTIDFVYRNRVPESIYNLREYAPDQVQVTERPTIKKGTAEFTISHDPKLRAKLEETINFLGGELQRLETVPGGGMKGMILGSYSPMESLVRMRIGSTEGTLAHEVGHMLDHKLGLKEKLLEQPKVRDELQKLAEDRLNSEFELEQTEEGIRFTEEKAKAGQKYMDYIKNDDEVLANFFDAYVNSPEQLAEVAPHALKAFEKILSKNDKQLGFIRDIKPSTSRQTEKVKKDVFGKGDVPPYSVPFWKNGKEQLIRVSKPMFESLSSMRPSQLNVAEKFFYKALRHGSGSGLLRYGATSTPEFTERNVVKDTLEATVQSGVKYGPSYIPKSLYGILTGSKEYQDFVKSGGKFGSFMALDDVNIEKAFEDILKPKSALAKLLRHPVEAWEKIPKTSETMTRFGVYRAALDKGYSPIEASHYALDATLQFPRGGTISKKINKFVPFFNVGLLATEKLLRAFKEDPKTMTLRGITYLTTPAVLVSGYYLYGADEETRQSWLEIPIDRITAGEIPFNYDKATGEWNYMPTPYALGYLFSGLPMLAMRQMQTDAPEDGRAMWQHLMRGFVGSISPINDWSSVIPPTIKVALEDTSNFDYFRGREIYSKYKEGDATLDRDKTNPYDSETAKAIGDYFDASPALIDHTIKGLTGGLGGYALKASDAGVNAYRRSQGIEVPERPHSGADGIAKGFTIRAPEGYRSNSFAAFQSNYLRAQAIEAHFKNLSASPEKSQYQADNTRVIAQVSQLKAAHKQITARSKQISEIYDNAHMSSAEKTEKIARLEKEITRIARTSNNQYNTAAK